MDPRSWGRAMLYLILMLGALLWMHTLNSDVQKSPLWHGHRRLNPSLRQNGAREIYMKKLREKVIAIQSRQHEGPTDNPRQAHGEGTVIQSDVMMTRKSNFGETKDRSYASQIATRRKDVLIPNAKQFNDIDTVEIQSFRNQKRFFNRSRQAHGRDTVIQSDVMMTRKSNFGETKDPSYASQIATRRKEAPIPYAKQFNDIDTVGIQSFRNQKLLFNRSRAIGAAAGRRNTSNAPSRHYRPDMYRSGTTIRAQRPNERTSQVHGNFSEISNRYRHHGRQRPRKETNISYYIGGAVPPGRRPTMNDTKALHIHLRFNRSGHRRFRSFYNRTENNCYNKKYKSDSLTGISWGKELIVAANRVGRNGSIVLTGGNWAYRGAVLNWMAHAENIGLTEYIVLCYGEDMLRLVGPWEEGGHGILVVDCEKIIEFMFMKITAMSRLHSADFIVTWSDCDSLWLRPFMNEWILPYRDQVDIIAQKALHPRKISLISGSVICTGLFTVFPNPRTRRMFQILTGAVVTYILPSDQMLLNTFIWRLGSFSFRQKVDYYLMSSTLEIPDYLEDPQGHHLRIGFLPYPIFPRSRNYSEWKYLKHNFNPAVWHSKSDKIGETKIDAMHNSSVFLLKDGWEQVRCLVDISNITNSSILDLPRKNSQFNAEMTINFTDALLLSTSGGIGSATPKYDELS